jgi:hypothetical protein
MDAETLRKLADRYRRDRDLIRNEEQTKQSLVIPFFKALGYDPTNPREVRLEYAAPFTENDGKRHADRMDLAIFDATGVHPLLVVETKPLGADVRTRSPQLARYMGQMPELRFGIMTDGCHYLFFGDLRRPNIMDETPFFQFSLDDANLDFAGVAAFLEKFSRGQFSAVRLITEAEDSRYRQGMIRRLVDVLQDPGSDEAFVRWLSEGVYEGKRSRLTMERLTRVARSTIKPAILRVLGEDYLDDLRQQILDAEKQDAARAKAETGGASGASGDGGVREGAAVPPPTPPAPGVHETTDAELAFAEAVRQICSAAGVSTEHILHKDTTHYMNVSYRTPSRWFVRFFDKKRAAITTLVPVEDARGLAGGFEVEAAPPVFGVSRVYVDGVEDLQRLRGLVLRSLDICRGRSAET